MRMPWFFAVSWMVWQAGAVLAADSAADLEFFEKRIRPVLVAHCYECHSGGARKVQGGLRVDTREGMRQGGESGPAIVPGKPAESLLLEALRYESLEMPPKGKLPDAVIADFETWIKTGAVDPRGGEGTAMHTGRNLAEARRSWPYHPPQRPELPAVVDADWPRGAVDRFVLWRLEQAGLHPAADADRQTLLRRVTFDLIGLPPAPEEIDAFLQDASPQAYEHVVDRLLASPQFGERWGRHWLDVARFSESSGGGRTMIFPEAWRYRDYVIAAFNADKPFDEFIREQIAGDLLPPGDVEQQRERLVALGFLVLGPTNYELQDKLLLRMEVVDEQIDTMGKAFLGMTLGCARCHDHKFDPISLTDYYALAGIFRSTKTLVPGNVSGWTTRPLPMDEDRRRELEAHQRQMAALEQEVQQLSRQLAALRTSPGENAAATLTDLSQLPGIVVDDAMAQVVGDWTASASVKHFIGEGYLHDGNAGDGRKSITFQPQLPEAAEYEVRLSYTAGGNRAENALVLVRHAEGETELRINQRRPPNLDGLFVSLGKFRFGNDGSAAVTISNRGTKGYVIADAVQFLPASGAVADAPARSAASETARFETQEQARQMADLEAQLAAGQQRLEALRKSGPPAPPAVMAVLEEAPEEIGDCRVHIRGNPRNLGPAVPRGVVAVASLGESSVIEPTGSGRLQLAEWLASPHNPLTARVAVNRIWHHLFGQGIVRTVDNFGTMGERPSHPELLDWLAVEFMEQGWSTKRMVRQLVLSRTYQQASAAGPTVGIPHSAFHTAHSIDPENRLLSHMNRRRLEAEAIRDAMLQAGGGLDVRMGGTEAANLKSEFGYSFTGRRRSVYVPVFRSTLHELFEVFDFADPNLSIGRRNTSTLPTQALYLMNSPFVLRESQAAAEAILAIPDVDDAARLRLAYCRTLSRPPTKRELELSLEFLADAGPDRTVAWSRLIQALFASIDFRYVY